MSTFVLQTIATDIAIDTEPNLNVVLNSSRNFEKSFVNDGGDTIKVRKPDYGGGLTSGLDVSSVDDSITQASIDVTIAPFSTAVGWTVVEESLKVGNFDEMVSKPRAQKNASDIQKKHIEKMMLGIGSAKILGTAGTATYKNIREMSNFVEKSKINGDMFFACDPLLATDIKESGDSKFQASSLDPMFNKRSLGAIDGVECMKCNDFATLTSGTRTLGAGTATRVKTKVDTEGATSFIIEVSGGTATLTGSLKKGEIVYLAGYNGVDVEGKDNGIPYPFVQQSDVNAAANEIVVTCPPIYFTGPNKNVNVAQSVGIAATTAVTFGMANATTYALGVLWTPPAVIFCNRPLPKIASTESVSANTSRGLQFLLSKYGNGDTGKNKLAYRIMAGSAVAYEKGVSGLYVKIS